ncbi:Sjogren's syndrome/scleroderma autoantigen 1 family protein [Natrialbaceae archaeon GCM10025810]|uniref:Sjogren's syndrome/scleroderma autoantigen 1 family protein n=1 Tax=Halovalidus salilacus TaxID=3075124 RepID=UPI00361C8F83
MSDFDKEAERERLREKYERDKADREATQRMSDLLLKGARMTNTHCGTCGDPLFQMNGVTFCPTCHGSPEAVEGSALEADAEGGAQSTAEAETGTEAEAADADATDADGDGEPAPIDVSSDSGTADDASAANRGDRPDAETVSSANRDAEFGTGPASETEPQSESTATSNRTPRTDPTRSQAVTVDGDLEAGRDALVEALERFARTAAATDDPRYAKECLEAAREAAEALAALR